MDEALGYFYEALAILEDLPGSEDNRRRRLTLVLDQTAGFHYLHRHADYYELLLRHNPPCAGAERFRPPRGILRSLGTSSDGLRRIQAGERDREPGTRALRAVRQPRERGTRMQHLAMGAHAARRVPARPPVPGAGARKGEHVRTNPRRAKPHNGGRLGDTAA